MSTTIDQIDSAYRRLALQYHPDWNRNNLRLQPTSQLPAIALLSHAREVLHEPFLSPLANDAVSSDLDLAQNVHYSRPPLTDECMFCASIPSTQTTLRHQEAFFIDRRQLQVQGPMCQGCGLALATRMQSRSLWTGWWGLRSFFSNMAVVSTNLAALFRLWRLGPPSGRKESVVSLLHRPLQS